MRATATEASGFTETVSTSITILPGQPPAVTITASNNSPTTNETVIFTATVLGATSTIIRYEWNFGGPGAVPPTAETTGNRATASYTATGTKYDHGPGHPGDRAEWRRPDGDHLYGRERP